MAQIDNMPLQACGTLIEVLRHHVEVRPDALAFSYIARPETGEGPSLTYAQLDEKARRIAALLRTVADKGDRVLLFFPPGLDYIAAFLGGLYAGVVVVPLYPPRRGEKLDRVRHVVADCSARCAIGLGAEIDRIESWYREQQAGASEDLAFVAVERAEACAPIDPRACGRHAEDTAFLQYTSGSTGEPKGVIVSHRNLMANQAAIAEGFGTRSDDVSLSWLPLYHDMGLIGTTLHPLYCGFPAYILAPVAFIKDPLVWLENSDRFGATIIGGPDFAFAACAKAGAENPERAAGLGLSRVRLAFNGSEPIRSESLQAFADVFAPRGFRKDAFFPCYGLAEATLFVTGADRERPVAVWRADDAALGQGELRSAPPGGGTALVASGVPPRGVEVRIVEDGRALPDGRIGEIWVSGPSVSSGYWGREATNPASFQARIEQESPPRAYLRTGDLGCLQEGRLIVTGRLKDVIILNGRNYYPQDIEAASAASHAAARAGGAAALGVERGGTPGLVIVQEVEPRHVRSLDSEALRRAVRAAVSGSAGVDVADVVLIKPGTLPRTSSGKIRRSETRSRYLEGRLQTVGEAAPAPAAALPETGAASVPLLDRTVLAAMPPAARAAFIEAVLASAVAKMTGAPVEAVRRDVPLPALGLGSISIVQLHNALERQLGVAADDRHSLFDGVTLRELAEAMSEELAAKAGAPARPVSGGEAPRALSAQQQQLWFLYQLDPSRNDYNLPLLVECSPAFDAQAFRRAVRGAVGRHSILRTVYGVDGEESVQTVRDEPSFDLIELDGLDEAAARERLSAAALDPFDLEHGPVLRAGYARLGGDRALVLLCVHHIASDFWSFAALAEEIFMACAGAAVPAPDAGYGDWAAAQQRYLESDAAKRDLAYWRRLLGAGPASSGLDRFAGRAAAAGRVNFRIPGEILADARDFAASRGKTLNAVLLAAYQMLLHLRGCGRRLAVGTMTAGRTGWRYENCQGYFANPVALLSDWTPEDSFDSFLAKSSAQLAEAVAHQAYPFPALVKALAPSNRERRHPFFQAVFLMQQSQRRAEMAGFAIKGAESRIALGELRLAAIPVGSQASAFDLTLTLAATADGIEGMLEHGPGIIAPEEARRLAADYVRLLETALAGPARPAAKMLPAEAPPTAPAPPTATDDAGLAGCRSLLEGFERQVRRSPDSIALSFGGSLTYGELGAAAERLAGALAGVSDFDPLAPVAVLLHRGPDVVVAILAILKAGASYLPLDPYSPPERLALILEDSRPSAVITSGEFGELLDGIPAAAQARRVAVDAPAPAAGAVPGPHRAERDDRAYIIFTSGSTGRPKGVQVTHGNALRLFTCCEDLFRFDAADVWTLFHSFAFDFSVWEMWGALLYGGRLVIVPWEVARAPEDFRALIAREGVTVLNQTPSAFGHLARVDTGKPEKLDSLRVIVFGGEALVLSSLRGWMDKYGDEAPRLVNMYGITETTVHVTYRAVRRPDLDESRSLIGGPLPDLTIELLDDEGRRVPPGEVGEIYVGGAGVSLGYLGSESLTRERFVDLELDPGERRRFYRSGDLARRVSDCDYEFCGRGDNQVSINGFRIELREIESALQRFPGISQAVVMAQVPRAAPHRFSSNLPVSADAMHSIRQLLRAAPAPETRPDARASLTAYVVAETLPDVRELHAHLGRYLPDYMVPQAVYAVSGIPLTTNGKVDTAALERSADGAVRLAATYVAPRTEEERILARLFSEVLELPRVGVDDGFFELGGDSIRIIQLRSRALKAGLSISVQDVFRLQTPAALAAVARSSEPVAEQPRLAPFAALTDAQRADLPEDAVDAYPLARLQEGLLFHSLYGEDVAMYCDIFEFRVSAPYDAQLFGEAVQALMDRHPIFRTSFDFARFDRPVQIVHRHSPARVTAFDYRGLETKAQESRYSDWLEREKRTPYDISSAPLVRFSLHRFDEREFIFTMSFHDALLDGWSESSTVSELLAAYFQRIGGGEAAALPPIRTGFVDYVALEQEALADPEIRRFWQAELQDMRPTRLPAWSVPAGEKGEGMAFYAVDLPPELSDRLKALARQLGVSVKHVLLAAHAAVTGYVCGEADMVLAVESNGRLEDGDGEQVLGTHLNVVPWRLRLADESWESLIQRIRDQETALQPYRRFPYQEIQQLRGNEPLFNISFNYTHFHVYEELAALDDLEILDAKAYIQTHFALRVEFNQDPFSRNLTLDLEANLAEVPESQVRSIGGYFRAALESIAEAPGSSVIAARMLGEQGLADELAAGAGPSAGSGEPPLFLERLAAAAEQWPERIAATDSRRTLTYAELISESRRAAVNLRRAGVGPGDIVGLLADRSIEFLVAMIGLFRVGAAFVPLPTEPLERIQWIVRRAGARHILFGESHRGLQAQIETPGGAIALETLSAPGAEAEEPDAALGSEDLAYVIFTSGSTGEPKGVMIEHGGMANHLQAKIDDLGLGLEDKISQDAAATFDICVWQFLAALLVGGRSVIFPDEISKDPAQLIETVVAQGITILEVSPSVLSTMLVTYDPPVQGEAASAWPLRWVVSSGEALPPSLVRGLRKLHDGGILNMWGATETSDDCTHYAVPAALDPETDKVSIGEPIANAAVHVLDPWGRVVPRGTPGELHVAGLCVGRGYVNDPERTAAAFLEDPFAPPGRLYRTGDRGYRDLDGLLYFSGRRDHQVKIRGHRIELGEVSAALDRLDCVHESAVLAIQDADGQLMLAAWIVPADPAAGRSPDFVPSLRKALCQHVSRYMVPDVVVPIEQMPKNENGKVDRAALVVSETVQVEIETERVDPRNETETLVLELFRQILKRPVSSIDTGFFDAGGNSLLATQLVAYVRRSIGVHLPIRALFEHDTVRTLSAHIAVEAARAHREDERILPQERRNPIPLSFNQERLWFIDRMDPSGRAYNSHMVLRIEGPLAVDALAGSLQQLVDRHEILRTRFVGDDDHVHQEVADRMELEIRRVDLSALPEDQRSAAFERSVAEELSKRFRLDTLPLCNAVIYRLGPDEHVLLWRNHHIIGDGWSAGVMLGEVAQLYQARAAGREASLPPLPIQFADYALWQRSQVETQRFADHVAFWEGYLAGHNAVLDLPTDRERPPVQSFEGRRLAVEVPPDLTAAINGFCRRSRWTLFTFLQGALGLLLSRYAKQSDLLIGTPIAGRQRVETERLLGFLTNTLPVRLKFDRSSSFAEHLARLHEQLLELFEHQDVPFAHLVNRMVKGRDPSRAPLIQALFVLQNEDLSIPRIDGLKIEPVEFDRSASILDLVFDLQELDGRITGHVEYNSALFEEETIRALWFYFLNMVHRIIADPDLPISELSVLGETHRGQLEAMWQRFSHRLSDVHYWSAAAPETPHWDDYIEAAEEEGLQLSAYMAISEY
jgi:amino acid adenylation domain-containing protein